MLRLLRVLREMLVTGFADNRGQQTGIGKLCKGIFPYINHHKELGTTAL